MLTLASGLPSWAAGGGSGTVTSITPGADAGSGSAITTTGTLTSTGGNGIDTSVTGTTTTFDLDLNELTDDTGTASTGWSAGDFVAIVDSGDSSSKKIKLPAEIGVAVSDETTTLSTGDDQITFLVPRNMTITEVKASLSASDSTGVDIDVRYHATDPGSASTIFASDLSISSGAYYGTKAGSTVFVGSAASKDVAENGFLVVDINYVSDATGLKLWVLGYWT